MLLTKDEINDLVIKVNTNENISDVKVYLKDKLIHTEKLYVLRYENSLNRIKRILLFWK